jgi:hypothetical protein
MPKRIKKAQTPIRAHLRVAEGSFEPLLPAARGVLAPLVRWEKRRGGCESSPSPKFIATPELMPACVGLLAGFGSFGVVGERIEGGRGPHEREVFSNKHTRNTAHQPHRKKITDTMLQIFTRVTNDRKIDDQRLPRNLKKYIRSLG